MTKRMARIIFAFAGLSYSLAPAASKSDRAEVNTTLAVEGGTAAFVANTNISAISVKGKSTAMHARVRVQQGAGGLHLEHIEASIPVNTLATGMGVRDEHMRKYIFMTGDGKTPDVRFEGKEAECPVAGQKTASDKTCVISGTLSIRGLARPFSVPLKIHEEGAAFKAAGESAIKLSDYGIEQPSQFGVKTANEVQLHFEFTGRQAPEVAAAGDGK